MDGDEASTLLLLPPSEDPVGETAYGASMTDRGDGSGGKDLRTRGVAAVMLCVLDTRRLRVRHIRIAAEAAVA